MAIVTVLGAGMMGSALCVPLVDWGHEVRLVGTHPDCDIVECLRRDHVHPTLKHNLPESIQPTKAYATSCYVFDIIGGQRCQCDARPLPEGATLVPDCNTAESAGVAGLVLTSCPAGEPSVSTCSEGLWVEPEGGGCSGCGGTECYDDLCCIWSCENKSCVQNCNF